jgi:hypothetical protein
MDRPSHQDQRNEWCDERRQLHRDTNDEEAVGRIKAVETTQPSSTDMQRKPFGEQENCHVSRTIAVPHPSACNAPRNKRAESRHGGHQRQDETHYSEECPEGSRVDSKAIEPITRSEQESRRDAQNDEYTS